MVKTLCFQCMGWGTKTQCGLTTWPEKREEEKKEKEEGNLKTDLLYLRDICVCSVAQSCVTLCDPTDCSLPGSSLHGIFQARILECIAISYSNLKDRSYCFCFFFLFFGHTACGMFIPGQEIELMPLALEAWNLNHWTARKVWTIANF